MSGLRTSQIIKKRRPDYRLQKFDAEVNVYYDKLVVEIDEWVRKNLDNYLLIFNKLR